MAYFTLTPNQGHLVGEPEVNPGLKEKAERYATMRIDEAFFLWDRTTWTGATLPQQIVDAAELLTVGKYKEMQFATGNPEISSGSLSQRLLAAGEAAITRILDAGGPIDPTYPTRVLPKLYDGSFGRSVRMVRG